LVVENGGMGMINIHEFIDSKRIKLLYRILHEPLESWNAIGKYWLRKLDIKLSGDIVEFDSFKFFSLSLILKVTLRSGTIVVSPFKTFMNFSGIALFLLRQL
jgi:hypothetical protein